MCHLGHRHLPRLAMQPVRRYTVHLVCHISVRLYTVQLVCTHLSPSLAIYMVHLVCRHLSPSPHYTVYSLCARISGGF